MTADEFLKLARDHYWDTLEPQRELIIKHLESVVAMTELPKEWDTVAVCPDCKREFDTEKKMCINCGRKTK